MAILQKSQISLKIVMFFFYFLSSLIIRNFGFRYHREIKKFWTEDI